MKDLHYSPEPPDPEAFQDRFDRFYTRFARVYDLAVRMLPVWKGWLRQALPHIKGPRVLEVSFGTGYLMSQYADQFQVHGIDFNQKLVSVAARNLTRTGSQANLCQGSVDALPYEDGTFTTVLNTMAFSAYPDAARAMSEMRRVIAPEGRLVLIDINHPKDRNWLGMKAVRAWQLAGDIIRDLETILEEQGFEYEDREIGGFGSVHLYICTVRFNGSD